MVGTRSSRRAVTSDSISWSSMDYRSRVPEIIGIRDWCEVGVVPAVKASPHRPFWFEANLVPTFLRGHSEEFEK